MHDADPPQLWRSLIENDFCGLEGSRFSLRNKGHQFANLSVLVIQWHTSSVHAIFLSILGRVTNAYIVFILLCVGSPSCRLIIFILVNVGIWDGFLASFANVPHRGIFTSRSAFYKMSRSGRAVPLLWDYMIKGFGHAKVWGVLSGLFFYPIGNFLWESDPP